MSSSLLIVLPTGVSAYMKVDEFGLWKVSKKLKGNVHFKLDDE